MAGRFDTRYVRRVSGDPPFGTARPFSIDVDVLPTTVLVVVAGDVDLASADTVEDVTLQHVAALPESTCPVVLELSAVTYMDSTGLRALLNLRRGLGERLLLHAPSAPVARLIELTGVRSRFAIVDTF